MADLGAPPIDYYDILKYETLSYSGGWWSVVVLLRDPKTGKKSLALYKYKKVNDGFRKQTSYKLNNLKQSEKLIQLLNDFVSAWKSLPESEE